MAPLPSTYNMPKMALYYDHTLLWILSDNALLVNVVKYADHSSMPRLLEQDERLYNDWDVKSDWS